MPIWTDEQKKAITLQGNLLVSAAAGAGKTAVMTERIASLIANGTPVHELLVVTFTNAAAAEMKQRIEKRLLEFAQSQSDDEVKARLFDAASELCGASISTIHSFCGDVLRHNPQLAGVDPSFRIADEAEAALMRAEAMQKILEDEYDLAEKQADDAFKRLLDVFGSETALIESITKIYRFIIAKPEPEQWLDRVCIDTDKLIEKAGAEMIEDANKTIGAMLKDALDVKRWLETDREVNERYFAAIDRDEEDLIALARIDDYDELYFALLDFKFAALPRSKPGVQMPERIAEYRKYQKSSMKKLQEKFPMSMAEEKELSNAIAPCIGLLCELVKKFIEEYALLKQEAGAIDFDDMQQLCYEVLKNEAIAQEYKQRFSYIFVDEYQDTSAIQDAIINAVTRGNNLFLVGDVKQSIYRFRQAEPENFINRYKSYAGENGTAIKLNANFRSKSAVLDATNRLFSKIMLGDVGEIDYSDDNELVGVNDSDVGNVELALIDPDEDKKNEVSGDEVAEEEDEEDELELSEVEALYAVEKIRQFMSEGSVYDKSIGKVRKPAYSDFAVLMRKTAGSALVWVNILTRCGIPCTAELSDGYFEAIEVQVFINLLRIIDNKRQDIPMMSILRSPIGMFSDEEIARLKIDYDGENVLDCLISASDDNKSFSDKARRILELLNRWKSLSVTEGLEALVGRLLDETDYFAYVGILPGGAVRQANLEKLVQRAALYEARYAGGLHGFIIFLDTLRDNTTLGSEGIPAVDAVRIMSIHKSKGLEFPVVFVSALTSKFSKRDFQSPLILDNELGMGIRLRGFGIRGKTPLLRRAITVRSNAKLNAEEMRILYVAMTRAREKLYLIGTCKNLRKKIKAWASPLTKQRILSGSCYLDWMLGAYCPLGLNIDNADKGVKTGSSAESLVIKVIASKNIGRSPTNEIAVSKNEFYRWGMRISATDFTAAKQKYNFEYRFPNDTDLPAKRSVSEYMQLDYEYKPAIPSFVNTGEEIKTDFAAQGTATHLLLRNLPLTIHTEHSIKREIINLTAKGILSEDEAKNIYINGLLRLTKSNLWRRIISSERIEREKEFTFLSETGELIQGMIDCCFIEENAWILLDYKTTAVKIDSDGRTVSQRYAPQLEAYAKALSEITGLPVKEKWIYILKNGDMIEVK